MKAHINKAVMPHPMDDLPSMDATLPMGKVASMEGRSSIGWGITALLICAFIPIPLFGILLGMVMTYALMFAMNLMQK